MTSADERPDAGAGPARRRVPTRTRPPAERQAERHDDGAGQAETIYLRSLLTAQLRLAVAITIGFVTTGAVAAALIAVVPLFQQVIVLGVPLAWLLQAYGLYPLIAGFGVLYVVAAQRNERRFRSLESPR